MVGTYTVTYSCTDAAGNDATDVSRTVTVIEPDGAFITTWAASDSDKGITLPMTGTYTILWGDGSYDENVSGSQSHTYDVAGTYTVTVLGKGLESIDLLDRSANSLQIRSIEQWGDTEWTTMTRSFGSTVNMAYRATDAPDLSGVTDTSYMFSGASSFDGDLSGWDVSSVTNMRGMFADASVFNGNLSGWDVSSVIYMDSMFQQNFSFDVDISGWGRLVGHQHGRDVLSRLLLQPAPQRLERLLCHLHEKNVL